MATQDKLIENLTELLFHCDAPDGVKEEIINRAVNFAGTMYWEGVDEGKQRGFKDGYSKGYDKGHEIGMLDAVIQYENLLGE